MEEILASIRRIIADDDTKVPPKAVDPMPPPPAPVPPRPAAPPAPPPPRPAAVAPRPAPPPAPPPEVAMKQDEIDAMLNDLNASDRAAEKPDVLDLTEAMAAPAARSDGFRTIDGQADVFFEESPEPPEPPRAEPPRPAQDVDMRPLISSVTSAAVDSAFNSLAHTVLVQNARTLEDLVREMLRPMLKTWLDDNLPGLVERLVRAEIERVSRGRG
jgi:cell pole-organizing protein PopZ